MKLLKKIVAVVLAVIVFATHALPFKVFALEGGVFCLTVCADEEAVIEPINVNYNSGQTIRQALLESGISFEGLENGFFYSVEGVVANYSLFYDDNGYDLEMPASEITALVITDRFDCYSPELLELTVRMMQYRLMTNNVDKYPPAQNAYDAALAGVCEGVDGETSALML